MNWIDGFHLEWHEKRAIMFVYEIIEFIFDIKMKYSLIFLYFFNLHIS